MFLHHQHLLFVFPFLLLCSVNCADSNPTSSDSDANVDSLAPDSTWMDGLGDLPKPPLGIEGDWFHCLDLDCQKLAYRGWRFLPKGQIASLFASPPTLESNEFYCHTENPQLGFKYSYVDPDLKTVKNSSQIECNYKFLISGNKANVYDPDIDRTLPWVRVFPPRDSGTCAQRSPWICPDLSRTGGSSDPNCQWSFVCDNGAFKLDCSKAIGPSYSCKCVENDSKQVGQFSLAEACSSVSEVMNKANTSCGWELWKPPLSAIPPPP